MVLLYHEGEGGDCKQWCFYIMRGGGGGDCKQWCFYIMRGRGVIVSNCAFIS